MLFKEGFQQAIQRHDRRIVDDLDYLGVAGQSRRRFLIGRVFRETARIAGRGHVDARDIPEEALRTPKTAHTEINGLRAFRILQRTTADEMFGRGRARLIAARQSRVGARHRGLLGEYIAYVRSSFPA